jgi:hypothetical protein
MSTFTATARILSRDVPIIWTDGRLEAPDWVLEILATELRLRPDGWDAPPTFARHMPADYPADPLAVADLLEAVSERLEIATWDVPEPTEGGDLVY